MSPLVEFLLQDEETTSSQPRNSGSVALWALWALNLKRIESSIDLDTYSLLPDAQDVHVHIQTQTKPIWSLSDLWSLTLNPSWKLSPPPRVTFSEEKPKKLIFFPFFVTEKSQKHIKISAHTERKHTKPIRRLNNPVPTLSVKYRKVRCVSQTHSTEFIMQNLKGMEAWWWSFGVVCFRSVS